MARAGRLRTWLHRAAPWTLDILGWAGVAFGAGGLLARLVPIDWQVAVVAASFLPYLIVAAIVGGAILAVRRRRIGVAIAGALLVWAVIVQVPLFVGQSVPGHGVHLIVLQANLRIGAADPAALTHRVSSAHVDVLTVEELTSAEADRLTAAGLDHELPYRLAVPFPGGAGTGIWSRYPLTAPTRLDQFSFEMLTTGVIVPGAGPVQLYAVHLLPPWPYPAQTWVHEVAELRDQLAGAARGGGTVIASGDFNATLDNPQLRQLLGGAYRDAAEQAGAGYQPTYPTDRFFPPVLTLDHVLMRRADVASITSVELPGSDHRGLLVDLVIA